MQVKKFEAPTIQEALETIKRELGPEAIILQTKKYKRGFGLMSKASVEVTAAVSDRSMNKKQFVETRLPEPSRNAAKSMSAERQANMHDKYLDRHLDKASRATRDNFQTPAKKITATRYIEIDTPPESQQARATTQSIATAQAGPAGAVPGKLGSMTMEDELRHLKRMIEEIKSTQEEHTGSGAQALMGTAGSSMNSVALQDVFEQLVMNGIDKRFAISLIKRVSFELGPDKAKSPENVMDQIAAEIMESTAVISPLSGIQPGRQGGPVVIALVGPTGVGKTTTVAKMASEALLRRGLKVGLINLDSYKVAAFDQLGTYAKILNVPFRSAATKEDLKAAIQDFHSLDLVVVDTTGRSQRDPASLNEMKEMLSCIPEAQTHLVLSVTTRDTELYDMASRFSMFKPQGLIVSKLDEATIYGAIYNVSQKVKLPLLYFTTGQRVPEDIEEATQERVASLILDL